MANAFDEKLRKEPLPYRAPCAGCLHLNDAGDAHYVRCTVPLPLPAWAVRCHASGLAESFRNLTRKYVFGPHVPDARVHECLFREEGTRG